jgi:hypothetical protein
MMDVFAGDLYFDFFGKPVVLQSRLLLFVKERLRTKNRGLPKTAKMKKPQDQDKRTERQNRLSSYYLNSLYLRTQFYRRDRFQDFDGNVKLIRDSILAMVSLCRENSIQFAVAVFPDEIQVDAEVRTAFLDHYRMETNQFDWNRAQSILRQLCSEQGIEVFDLYPPFLQATQAGQKLYLPNNGHWNDAGNDMAAKVLSAALKTYLPSTILRHRLVVTP